MRCKYNLFIPESKHPAGFIFHPLLNHIATHVRHQRLRDANTFRRLVVFQQGGYDTRQCQRASVQRMAEMYLLVGIAVAALQAVGLIGIEVGYGADFQPALLGFGINLEVEADRRGKAHVPAAETQDAVWQLQLLQQSFHVVQHFLMGLLRMFRRIDAYQLDLRKLMQAVQATHVFPVGTGFATEALRVGTVLYRELFLVEDDVAVDIGYRDFGRRYQIQIIDFAMIHLPFLVGELTGTITRVSV